MTHDPFQRSTSPKQNYKHVLLYWILYITWKKDEKSAMCLNISLSKQTVQAHWNILNVWKSCITWPWYDVSCERPFLTQWSTHCLQHNALVGTAPNLGSCSRRPKTLWAKPGWKNCKSLKPLLIWELNDVMVKVIATSSLKCNTYRHTYIV